MTTEFTSDALAAECVDLISGGFPSYWNKPFFQHWLKILATLLKRQHPNVSRYLADPETGIYARSTYILDGVELLRACRQAQAALACEADKQASQQASKFPKAVEA